jgi:hypothetical protein
MEAFRARVAAILGGALDRSLLEACIAAAPYDEDAAVSM